MIKNDFLALFAKPKPVMGMIHLKGIDDEDVYQRAQKEIDIYLTNGIDGIILENYFGNYYQLDRILEYAHSQNLPIPYGVNCLNMDAMGFELAISHSACFVQLDSVVGHVKPRDEATVEAFLNMYRERSKVPVMGGVRFKYQPVLSANSTEKDLVIAKSRCDAVTVTQDATGQETSMDKILQFRNALGDFPLIVGAGVTKENIRSQFEVADGAIVGSYFKDTRKDTGELCGNHIKELMELVNDIRR
ncbi:MAG: membrane biogenesis protein [Hungatella sp.]|jgi:predicted TIM-barrel enzyme|nr:membrane biogenesis protein [Hungatella sp.]